MKLYPLLILFAIGVHPFDLWSQEDDISFTIRNIKENYPGYKDKTTDQTFDKFVKNILSEGDKRDEFWKLSKIVDFFNDKHLFIYKTSPKKETDSMEGIKNLQDIKDFIQKPKNFKIHEGIWVNDYNDCVLVIKKTKDNPITYKGYVLESTQKSIMPRMQLFEMEKEASGLYNTLYYDFYQKSKLRNDSVLLMGYVDKWKKITSYHYPIFSTADHYSYSPTGKSLDDSCFLISLPSCSRKYTASMDSILKFNKEKIDHSKTLIIDIRRNTGGSILVYRPLIPYIYTNPIEEDSTSCYCSPEFIKSEKQSLENIQKMANPDTSIINSFGELIHEMELHKGGNLFVAGGELKKEDSIKEYPKNVALIIDYGSASAAELMCLDFKQSKKVTIFGENSAGVVDYLDTYEFNTPSEKYTISMPGTRRIPSEKRPNYDSTGISPDVRISDSVIDWVDFVKKYYEKN